MKPVWSPFTISGSESSNLVARILESNFLSTFRREIGLYEEQDWAFSLLENKRYVGFSQRLRELVI